MECGCILGLETMQEPNTEHFTYSGRKGPIDASEQTQPAKETASVEFAKPAGGSGKGKGRDLGELDGPTR